MQLYKTRDSLKAVGMTAILWASLSPAAIAQSNDQQAKSLITSGSWVEIRHDNLMANAYMVYTLETCKGQATTYKFYRDGILSIENDKCSPPVLHRVKWKIIPSLGEYTDLLLDNKRSSLLFHGREEIMIQGELPCSRPDLECSKTAKIDRIVLELKRR